MPGPKTHKNNNGVSNVVSRKMHEVKLSANAESPGASSPSLPSFNKNIKVIEASKDAPDLVCLSHLRWNFVYQRPQHLLSRCAQGRRVFFIEEPIFGDYPEGQLAVSMHESGVWVVVPHLPKNLTEEAASADQQVLLDGLFTDHQIRRYICWYYTPMALAFTHHLQPLAVVYDCMDELSAFKGASSALRDCEAELFRRADLVFTGGQSLYESKVHQHPNVYAFPSSVDVAHFQKARNITQDLQKIGLAGSGGCLPGAGFLGSHLARHESADRVCD